MYILDTSALRGISKKDLENAANNHAVSISTISILEMASHLSDSSNPLSFSKSRGNFLKCKIPTVLNDPFWAISQKINLPANSTRKEDKEILLKLLDVVEESETLEALSKKTLTFPDGNIASCDSVGARISQILAEEENCYFCQILKQARKIALDPSKNGQHKLVANDLFSSQISFTKSLINDDSMLRARSFCATAIYTGYILSRLYFYANKRARNTEKITIDKNDCEDAYICLHLDISNNEILVTDDKGTISAIKNTIQLLNAVLPNKISEDKVINTVEFLARIKS